MAHCGRITVKRPRIGILFITSGWFRDVGLQGSHSELSREVESLGEEIVQRLSRFVEPVYSGVQFSEKGARAVAEEMKSQSVDGLIVAPLMWCEDQIFRAALTNLPRLPLLLCLFLPYDTLPDFVPYEEMLKGSGLVGTLQASGFLKREGYRYRALSGYYRDEALFDELKDHCAAMGISRSLQKARCGILPFRCDQMSTTYVDEFTLRKLYGVELVYLELQRFKEQAGKMSEEEIRRFEKVISSLGWSVEVDQKNLTEAIRYALAMEKILKEDMIDIFAMNDIIAEMHDAFGLRPCLCNPRISDAGIVVTMEADVAAGVAMFALRLFSDQMPFYSELFTADIKANALLMGHPGYHSTVNHDERFPVRVVSDVEYENTDPFTGASTYFKLKPGPVTAVNSVYTGEKLRWTVFEGESLEGNPKLEGCCHLFCKPDTAVGDICNRAAEIGVSQHWIVIHGHLAMRIERLCSWLNIDYQKL